MSNSKYATFDIMKELISVCSSANVFNVQGLIDELTVRFPNFDVQYVELPFNDIDHFTFRGEDVGIMILCHSINNRRFAITNVLDALYDRFLPYSAEILGKQRICVVAHDFPATKALDNPDKYEEEMKTFENRQPTAFKTSSLVMMAGKLEGAALELQETEWKQLTEFLMNAARSPLPKPKSLWERIKEIVSKHPIIAGLSVIGFLALVIGLGVSLSGSSTQPTPTDPIQPTAHEASTNTLP